MGEYKFEFDKYFSREFLIAVALIAIATVAMFKILSAENYLTVFPAWAGACGTFVGIYTAGKTKQKKAAIAANGTNQ
jgi:hypothetical protein